MEHKLFLLIELTMYKLYIIRHIINELNNIIIYLIFIYRSITGKKTKGAKSYLHYSSGDRK